jgi:hypothetical protein
MVSPLDIGECTMCLNQLLRSEQITLMRYATATDPTAINVLRRKLSIVELLLHAHPYPHRPLAQGAR